jgi:hypothetical protein
VNGSGTVADLAAASPLAGRCRTSHHARNTTLPLAGLGIT